MSDAATTITLGGRMFAIAPLRLGTVKTMRREFSLVLQGGALSTTEMPDEPLIDAYTAIVAAAVRKADPSVTADAFVAMVDQLSPFAGLSELAIGAARVITLSMGDGPSGEAASPSNSRTSISTGSTL
jgi:hypothetical protein